MDSIHRSQESFENIMNRPRQGKMLPKLADVAHQENWPTPTEDDSSNVNPKPNRRPGLVSQVNETMGNWPTPVAGDAKNQQTKYAQGGTPLSMASANWPTPRVSGQEGYETRAKRLGHAGAMSHLESQVEYIQGTWPTPRVSDTEGGAVQNVEMENGSFSRKNKDGVRWGVKLRDATESWATPTTQEIAHPNAELTETGRRKTKDGKDSHSLNLQDQTENWPTPTANEDAAGLPTGNMQAMLGNHPNLRNVTGESQRGPQAQANQTSGQESLQNDQTSPPPSPKTLSPIFVEWMMGVPIGWTKLTALKPLETESYRQWLQSFSGG
jgi:hypothetical protein